MFINDILERVLDGSQKDYFSFETFVLNLLKTHLEYQNKPLKLLNEVRTVGDAVAEAGIDDIEGKTLIIIKYSKNSTTSNFLWNAFFEKPALLSYSKEYKNLLIITFQPLSRNAEKMYYSELNKSIFENLYVWGLDDINKIAAKHKRKANEIADNIFSLRVENAVKKLVDWEEEREERLQHLKDVYEKSQISLFLGAGVSSSAGMPDWGTLLSSLFVTYLTKELNQEVAVTDKDIEQIVDRLNSVDQQSALMAARYLRKGLSSQVSDNKGFTKTITDGLYRLRDKLKDIDSKLIKTISNLCMPRRTGARVRSVVTYNFDDLLERQLKTKSIIYQSIYSEVESVDPDELPIYHVHGFLPENADDYEKLERSTLVFSEEGYHKIYTDAYHWSNLVQLANLRDNSCVMIGLSLTDPNLRRLLDISARNVERPKHYAFLRRMSSDKFAYSVDENNKRIQVIDNLNGANDFLNKHHKLNEELMKELGVNVIWFKDFDELPELLEKVL